MSTCGTSMGVVDVLASNSFGISAISCLGLTSGMSLSVRVAGAKSASAKSSRLNGKIPVC